MTNRFAGFADNGGMPFEKYTPAVSRVAKPKNPTKPKVRNARNVAIDDEDGFIPNSKGMTMTNIDTSRGPYHAMLDRMARARQAITGESYAKAFTECYTQAPYRPETPAPEQAVARAISIPHRRAISAIGCRDEYIQP
jgi:hypothetical protein